MACWVFFLFGSAPSLATTYTLSDFGGAQPYFGSQPAAINNSGDFVGYLDTQQAFLYSQGALTILGNYPGGPVSVANGLNDFDHVCGKAIPTHPQAVLYADGTTTTLTAPPGSISVANAVNDSDVVVGQVFYNTGEQDAFVDSGGDMTDLGTLPGDVYSAAYGINNAGTIIGDSNDGSSNNHAFIVQGDVMSPLGSLGRGVGKATAINNLGQVVGDSLDSAGDDHAFLYTGGVMQDLGTLGGPTSNAVALNDLGQVIGEASTDDNGHATPFLYSDGVMTSLDSLIDAGSGWTFSGAVGINDAGVILGYGYDASHNFDTLILTPDVPEPVSMTLISICALVLLRASRKRITLP